MNLGKRQHLDPRDLNQPDKRKSTELAGLGTAPRPTFVRNRQLQRVGFSRGFPCCQCLAAAGDAAGAPQTTRSRGPVRTAAFQTLGPRAHKNFMAEEGNEHRFLSTLPPFGIKNPPPLKRKMNGLYPNCACPFSFQPSFGQCFSLFLSKLFYPTLFFCILM